MRIFWTPVPEQPTAPWFMFQDKRMTGNKMSVSNSNSAGKCNLEYTHACVLTQICTRVCKVSEENGSMTYLQIRSGNIYQPELQSSALKLVLGSFLVMCIWTSPFQGYRNHTGSHGTWQAFPEIKHHKWNSSQCTSPFLINSLTHRKPTLNAFLMVNQTYKGKQFKLKIRVIINTQIRVIILGVKP